jgi:hypothetical protein
LLFRRSLARSRVVPKGPSPGGKFRKSVDSIRMTTLHAIARSVLGVRFISVNITRPVAGSEEMICVGERNDCPSTMTSTTPGPGERWVGLRRMTNTPPVWVSGNDCPATCRTRLTLALKEVRVE